LLLVVKPEIGLPETQKDFSLGGRISLWLARNRTTSRFSFLMGTMSSKQVNGKPEMTKLMLTHASLKLSQAIYNRPQTTSS